MTPHFRHAVAVLAVLAGTGAAFAQTVITREPAQTVITREPLDLSREQRTVIYRRIVREPAPIVRERVVRQPAEVVEYRVGARVPQSVELVDVPEELAVEVPAIRSYRYMVVNNRVLLVDPSTSVVIGEVVE